ncbi:hypothetical protein [Peptoniphilus obesi]|uniref:hypothetical protein n=1 Tax=Peptoniphilus obesi TaxID=1472765 RepID=UPI0004B03D08|nr:hypothetical protein [Peptoniphilus obesi]
MIKEIENNTIQITLEFYNVIIKVSEQRDLKNFNLSVEESIEKYFTNLKNECKKYAENSSAINIEDSGTFIELLPTEENIIFGIIGKSSEIKEGVLKRIKNSNGKEINQTDLNIENYKYFLFDIETSKVVVMVNSNYSAFQQPFTKFLESFNSSYSTVIKVEREIDNDIGNKINRMTSVLETEMEFAKNSQLTDSILSFEDDFGFSNDDLTKIKINLQVSNEASVSKFKKFINDKLKIGNNFKNFKVTTKDEKDETEVIDLIKRYLTKKVTIELKSEYLKDSAKIYFKEIKKALSKSLIN